MIDIFGFNEGRASQIRGVWKCLHYPCVIKCIYSKNWIWNACTAKTHSLVFIIIDVIFGCDAQRTRLVFFSPSLT